MPLGVLLIILGIIVGYFLSSTLGIVMALVGFVLLIYPALTSGAR